MRSAHIAALCRHPKSKPRHEAVDVKLFTEKKEDDFVTVYEAR